MSAHQTARELLRALCAAIDKFNAAIGRKAAIFDEPDFADAWEAARAHLAEPVAQQQPRETCLFGGPPCSFYAVRACACAREDGLPAQQPAPACKTDPRAPHGFLRNESHSKGRYVCECEYWEPPANS